MTTKTVKKSSVQLYRKTTLRNGLRVVTERIPSVRSISLGVWVDVGSRDETPAESGISHLIEHMLFKGTKRRTAKQVAESLESLGGQINAFTSREQTCYNVRVLDEYLGIAVDVLSDITCHSTLTPVNLRKEKQVILEEIKEADDNPSDRIHDIFAETYWGRDPLGQPILGSAENVSGFPRATIMDYIRRHYRTGSIVIAAAGNVSHDRLVRLVRENFVFEPGRGPEHAAAQRTNPRAVNFAGGGNAQTHLCIGFPGISYTAPNRMAVMALNLYLGGSMSSVVFQKIREELGLAYSVYTYADFYRDAGIFGAYAGTDKQHVARALQIMLKELDRVKHRRLPSAALNQLKAQMKGQMMLGMESTSSRMNRLARQECYLGSFIPFDQLLTQVDRLKASDLMDFANQAFDRSQLAVATLGPVDRKALRHVLDT